MSRIAATLVLVYTAAVNAAPTPQPRIIVGQAITQLPSGNWLITGGPRDGARSSRAITIVDRATWR